MSVLYAIEYVDDVYQDDLEDGEILPDEDDTAVSSEIISKQPPPMRPLNRIVKKRDRSDQTRDLSTSRRKVEYSGRKVGVSWWERFSDNGKGERSSKGGDDCWKSTDQTKFATVRRFERK